MTWKEIICDALSHLGGEARLQEIYDYIETNKKKNLSKTWQATVRGVLERASSDSESFEGKDDLFYSAQGLGLGIWGLREFEPNDKNMDLTQDDLGFSEGRKKLRTHIVRERNHQVITLAKKNFLAKHGCLKCEICGFDFYEHYGSVGEGFIEGHHIKPVSKLQPGEKTKVDDIVLLCSNCHSMIHKVTPWVTKDKLGDLDW